MCSASIWIDLAISTRNIIGFKYFGVNTGIVINEQTSGAAKSHPIKMGDVYRWSIK